jgi:serine/threonine-protein kinase
MLGENGARIDGANPGTGNASRDEAWKHGALELTIGEAVGGTDWILEGTLGRGGMAVVLAVVKRLGGIRGAMKVPHPELVARKEVGARFLEEAQLYTSLRHPHIVNVIDCGLLQGGTPFMVMERLRGRTLRQVMSAAEEGQRPLKPSTAYEVVSCVCDALQRLHSHRPVAVVHRDVKPENIFIHEVEGVAGRGTVKLLDLGLAGQVGVRRKVTMGTPRYMAPEQILGDGVSEHTDQYAVALVLYEMLSGRLPWNADVTDAEAMAQVHLKKAPLPLSQFCPWVPKSVNDAIERALDKDPERRLPTILHFLDGIRELDSARRGLDEADVYTTATTAPTLGSLAAYDTSPGESPAMVHPSWVEEAPIAEDSGIQAEPETPLPDRTPRAASSLREAEGRGEGDVDSRKVQRQTSAAPPTTIAKSRGLLARGAASGSLGLGFCLGVAAAVVAMGIRSRAAAPKPPIDAPPLAVATDPPPLQVAVPARLLTGPGQVPTLAPSEESTRPVVTPPVASKTTAPAAPPAAAKPARAVEHAARPATKSAKAAAVSTAIDDGREFFEKN